MADQRAETQKAAVSGTVLDVDYDADTISVELDDGRVETFPFEAFDNGNVYQTGQRFELKLDGGGQLSQVGPRTSVEPARTTVSGYVESVDQDDELIWIYIRSEEGWQRKVMPLSLFRQSGLDRPGLHFLLELDEQGTPLALTSDEAELEMLPLAAEQTKPRWTSRPAADAEPER